MEIGTKRGENLPAGKVSFNRKLLLMKTAKILILLTFAATALSAVPASASLWTNERKPRIVREAERRERERQDSTWTPENIRDNPVLFLQETIGACDLLKNKIEAQEIAFIRLKKQAERKVSEAESTIRRYTKFLDEAKKQYKIAKENDSFPVEINGFELSEEELADKVADALERVELAKSQKKTNGVVVKKVKIRQGVLKTKTRELRSIRRKLVLQLEQVKMNEALGEIDELTNVLGTIKDMQLELSEDPTKLSLDDITEEDPDSERKQSAEEFLEGE